MSCCCWWPRCSSCTSCSGCCTRASSIPITILSTLPSAGIGALLALMLAGDDLTIIALIGIILLIGIVKKNAILMIDFAIDAERAGGPVAARGYLPGLPAALPAHPHDHGGGDLRRAAADVRHRHRLGAAPSARREHRRRACWSARCSPCSPHRSSIWPSTGWRSACGRAPRGRTRRSCPRRARHEHLGAVHRPPGGDHAADGRRGAVRRGGLHPAAGRTAAAHRRAGHLRVGDAARARARRSWPAPSRPRWSGTSAPSPTSTT